MSEHPFSGEHKYTVYFIGDATHCVLQEKFLKNFAESFLELSQKTKRGVRLIYLKSMY